MSSYHGLSAPTAGPYPGATSKRLAAAAVAIGSREYDPCSDPDAHGLEWRPLRAPKSVRILSAPVPVVDVSRSVNLTSGSWRTSLKNVHSVASAQKDSDRVSALLLAWLIYLEANGEVAGIRELTTDDEAMKQLLRLTKIGTARRHLAMARRFRMYLDSLDRSTRLLHRRVLIAPLVHGWLQSLRATDCGAHTLHAGLSMVKWTAVHLMIEQTVTAAFPLYKLAADWRGSKAKLPNQAQAFPRDLVVWLERVVLDPNEDKVTRLLCGRFRLLVGASLRGDDLRRTSPSSLEWIRRSDQHVGLTGLAHKSKTGPRRWVCSVLGASPSGDGWLQATLDLLLIAHGAQWSSDDHLGKSAVSSSTWSSSPVVLSKDVIHLRESLVHHGFDTQVAAQVRTHGAKATLPSLGMHLGLNLPAIRTQGGWAAPSSEQMPDRYTRDKQLLALDFQEKCLAFWRDGGSFQFSKVPALGPSLGVQDAVQHSSEDSPSSSSSSSSSTPRRQDTPHFVANDRSGVLHKSSITGSARCNRGGNHLSSVTVDELIQTNGPQSIRDTRGRVCELCFPRMGAPEGLCRWLCTQTTERGPCLRRCSNLAAEGHQCHILHLCDVHREKRAANCDDR
eukprot:6462140-Amphidinium_carterae.1